jgi:hypothetical protein
MFLGTLFALALLLSSSNTYAQENSKILRNNISELREIHKDMKVQVGAGKLSVEDARARWEALVAQARAEKEAFFSVKMNQIEVKYQEVLERNPERAALLKEYIDMAKERRDKTSDKRVELEVKIKSGDITKKEARQQKIEFAKTQRDDFQEIKNNLQKKRREIQANGSNTIEARQVGRQNVEMNSLEENRREQNRREIQANGSNTREARQVGRQNVGMNSLLGTTSVPSVTNTLTIQ